MFKIDSLYLKFYIIEFMFSNGRTLYIDTQRATDTVKANMLSRFMFANYSDFMIVQDSLRKQQETLYKLSDRIKNDSNGYAIVKSIMRHYNIKHIDTDKAGKFW